MKLLLPLLAALLLSAQDDGAAAMKEGRFEDAERIYRQRLRDSPNDARLRFNLGLALYSNRRYEPAVLEFRAFLESNPKPGPAHLLLGVSLLKLNRHCDAATELEAARRWQASAQVLTELGDAAMGCRNYALAADAYRNAAQGNPRLLRATAHAFWLARDYSNAKPAFEAVRERFAADPAFLYEFGDTLARADGAAAGLPLLELAAAATPPLLPARGALGRALVELGRYADAIPHLEAAAPADAAVLLPLSRAYKETGRPQEAARTLEDYKRRIAGQN